MPYEMIAVIIQRMWRISLLCGSGIVNDVAWR